MLDGTFDADIGGVLPVRTLEQFSKEQREAGVLPKRVSPALLYQLFSGKMYPDLEVDGKPVDWSSLPRAARGQATGQRIPGTIPGKTLHEQYRELKSWAENLQHTVRAQDEQLKSLRDEVKELHDKDERTAQALAVLIGRVQSLESAAAPTTQFGPELYSKVVPNDLRNLAAAPDSGTIPTTNP